MSTLSTLTTSGHQPNINILNNEASSSPRQGFLKNKIQYHLVPPYLHRRNTAKCAIQKFKAHFIKCLCAADPRYTAKEQDNFLPQATLNLNMLQNCRFNPKLSAHAALHGTFDYNKKPLSTLGNIVLVHERKTNRRTWAPSGTNARYTGTYLEHY